MVTPVRRPISQKQNLVIQNLGETKGDLIKALVMAGASELKHLSWMAANLNYVDQVDNLVIDDAKHAAIKLKENIEKNQFKAIEFQLNNKGQSLGYGGSKQAQINESLRVTKSTVEIQVAIIDSIIVYMDFNQAMKSLQMEQFEFVNYVNKSDTFRKSVFQQIHVMLTHSYSEIKEGKENHKAERLERWLDVLNDSLNFSTSTMMYIDILRSGGIDNYTYDDNFWASQEGDKICRSVREYIIEKEDYLLFCQLYFKRVLKKELKMMPYLKILARFYIQVYQGDRRRFICNLPVRHGKTEFVNALIFFMFLMDPAAIALHTAYGDTVLKPMRTRIESALNIDPFFKKLMQLKTNAAYGRFNTTDFTTVEGGNYLAFTINGQVTGRGGNALNPNEKGALMLDDVNAPKWKGTQHNINANNIVTNTLLSRIPHIALCNTQQRIGDDDLTAYLLNDSNANPPADEKYRLLVCYIPFDKNETTDEYYGEMQRKYPNVDFFGYEDLEYGVINPSMAHYAVKDTCPEAWHIYLTQYQQIPTETADRLFNKNMLIELRQDELGVDATTGQLMHLQQVEDKPGSFNSLLLTIFFHVDTSQLSEDTEGSDYTVTSVFGVCVDPNTGFKRAILFEQIQQQDIGINQFKSSFEGVATKWMSLFPKNDFALAVEQKSAGSVAKTTCMEIMAVLTRQHNVGCTTSLDLDRVTGESKRARGEQASQSLELDLWFRYYPYDLGKGMDTRFTTHGKLQTISDDQHWWHETQYEMINFTGRESKVIHDDCCEGIFDVANKMMLDGGLWREYVTYSTRLITEHNLVKG